MDDLWEEFIECFREETRMLFDQVMEHFYCTQHISYILGY